MLYQGSPMSPNMIRFSLEMVHSVAALWTGGETHSHREILADNHIHPGKKRLSCNSVMQLNPGMSLEEVIRGTTKQRGEQSVLN